MYSVDYSVTRKARNVLQESLKAIIGGVSKIIPRKKVPQNTHPCGFVLKKFCKILCKTNGLPTSIVMTHCVKGVPIRSYSGPHFSVFGLNAERYSVSLRIQFECGKMQTIIIPNTDTLYAVIARIALVTWRRRTNHPWLYAFICPVLFFMRFIKAAKSTIDNFLLLQWCLCWHNFLPHVKALPQFHIAVVDQED